MSTGLVNNKLRSMNADGAVTASDREVWFDSTGGALAITIPLASSMPRQTLTLIDVGGAANANNINFTLTTGDTVRGINTFKIGANYGAVVMSNDGVNKWNVISNYNGM